MITIAKMGLSALLILVLCQTHTMAQKKNTPLVITEQGSFAIGGTTITNPGTFHTKDALKPDGQTFHGDHAYVFYQVPGQSRKLPLVFLHGAGQSKKTWESTPDGREGFQNIFLRRKYPVYLLDQPRRGAAGRSTVEIIIQPVADEQFWFTQFRLGNYPDFFPNVQFPKDQASLDQFYRQMTPNTGNFDPLVIRDAVSSLFDKIGEGILVTHSQGGGPGWLSAIDNEKIKAVIAYEPYSSFVFPEDELPEPIVSNGLFGELKGTPIVKEDFLKLTKVPIVIYYGDNIATQSTDVWNMDHWRSGLEMARIWAKVINKYGGDAQVVHLPEIGIYGNTHFPFSDLNNLQVADTMYQWLERKGLHK